MKKYLRYPPALQVPASSLKVDFYIPSDTIVLI